MKTGNRLLIGVAAVGLTLGTARVLSQPTFDFVFNANHDAVRLEGVWYEADVFRRIADPSTEASLFIFWKKAEGPRTRVMAVQIPMEAISSWAEPDTT
jgi:hypothetical protein